MTADDSGSGSDPGLESERSEVRTFLIADVRGYTRYTQTHGDEAAGALAARFATAVQSVVELREGRLLELRGDEALVVFASPRQAIRCALDLQRRFVDETVADVTTPLGVGIGIDSGEAVPVQGGYRGAALNVAARLCSKATAGEVLASGEAVHLARTVEGIRYIERGRMEFKGIDEPLRVVKIAPMSDDPTTDKTYVAAVRGPEELRRRQQRRRRQRYIAICTTVATGLVAIVTVVTVVGGEDDSLAAIGNNAVGVISIDGSSLHDKVDVGAGASALAADSDAVWVANTADDTVSRIDLKAPTAPSNTIPVGHSPSGVAVGEGAVWVTNAADRSVSRINPATHSEVDKITVGTGPVGIATGAGRVWVANTIQNTVSAINPDTDEVVATIPVGAQPLSVAYGFNALWVANTGNSTVTRINVRTKSAVASISVGNSPASLTIDPTGVWVANTLDDSASHIDPSTNSVVATVPVGHQPSAAAASGDAVWIANSNSDSVTRIDPEKNRVVHTVPVGNAPQALVTTKDDVWVSAQGTAAEHRGGTLRIVAAQDDIFTLDPAALYRQFGWNVLSNVHDGLVTYRRTAGPASAQVVPDLAVGVPSPTDEGKTYTFQLRAGLQYSDGKPVRASDFRASIERIYQIGEVPPFYSSILGSEHCQRHRPCDLSKGIVTDDEAGTITLHLSEADPDLLYKLALPFAVFLPADTSVKETGYKPLPATGPYMVTKGSEKRIFLERNPLFKGQSPQPEGYPDAIHITLVKDEFGSSAPSDVNAVARGKYDWTPAIMPPEVLPKLLLTRTGQLHVYPLPIVHYFFMNTKVAPFDDVRVRRAANLAVDRDRIIDEFSSDLLADPTCQVIPPTLPGYRPYCPYTVRPDPAGIWRGTDLAEARRLVAEAGARGARVRVVARPDQVVVAEEIARALRQIGLRTTVEHFPDSGPQTADEYFGYILDPKSHVQTALEGWASDYPSPSNIIPVLLSCEATGDLGDLNASQFCDKDLDAQMDKAVQLQATDPAASGAEWSRIDKAVVDQAPWIFLLNDRGYDIVSERVGNYQQHSLYGMLIDQVWVQ